ncbi:MAG: Nre family DNA repair protein [Halobacteriota archaeon]
MQRLCIACKGSRLLCERKTCPLLAALKKRTEFDKLTNTKEFFGPSTSVFVGRKGYPVVGVGPMTILEGVESNVELGRLEEPSEWFAQGLGMDEIVELRSATLRAKRGEDIKSRSNFVSDMAEIALAKQPVDVELTFKSKPSFNLSFSDITRPTGASVNVEKMHVTGNPKIPKKVDRIVSDELKAVEAANELYDLGLDVYKVAVILSSGTLGLRSAKKMVPTRWSITATDDLIFKKLAAQLKEYPTVDSYYVYESSYMDNHFLILLMPSLFEYENFEAWFPGSVWNDAFGQRPVIVEEYEGFKGRRQYAAEEGGGYYAARLAVAEALHKMRRQAGVVVFREIHPRYFIPLGVWVVRETVRDAFRKRGEKFDTRKEALDYIDSRLRAKEGLKLGIRDFEAQSVILRQKRLTDF